MIDLLSVEAIIDSAIKLTVGVGGVGVLSQLKSMANKKDKYKIFRKERVLNVIDIARILVGFAIGIVALTTILSNYFSIIIL